MQSLRRTLKVFLKDASSLGVLGIGSELRGDDIAGMLVAELLQVFSDKRTSVIPLRVFHGGTAPRTLPER